MNNDRTIYMRDEDWAALDDIRDYLVSKGVKCRSRSAALAYLIHRMQQAIGEPEISTPKTKLSPTEQVMQDRADNRALMAKIAQKESPR